MNSTRHNEAKIKTELIRRTRLILKAEVNSKNSITGIIMLAIVVITYSFNIIDWNFSEVKILDIKVRRMMTTHTMHHPMAGITSTISHFRYLNLSDDWMLVALKHEKEKVSHSFVKEAREFAREMDLDLETEFDGEMKNTENARQLKSIAKKKGKKAIDTVWKSKPLHGQYPLPSQKADVDLHDTHHWLRSAGLKVEAEGFVVAAQD